MPPRETVIVLGSTKLSQTLKGWHAQPKFKNYLLQLPQSAKEIAWIPHQRRACWEKKIKKNQELVSHWEKDCPCPPAQAAPSCEVSENPTHQIYQLSQWNNSQLFVAPLMQPYWCSSHHPAVVKRRLGIVYTIFLPQKIRRNRPFCLISCAMWVSSLWLTLSSREVVQWKKKKTVCSNEINAANLNQLVKSHEVPTWIPLISHCILCNHRRSEISGGPAALSQILHITAW